MNTFKRIKTLKTKTPLKIKFEHTLDLHVDKLAPHMENDIPGRIIEFQLQKVKNSSKKPFKKLSTYHHYSWQRSGSIKTFY